MRLFKIEREELNAHGELAADIAEGLDEAADHLERGDVERAAQELHDLADRVRARVLP